jgi:hypothetical protein
MFAKLTGRAMDGLEQSVLVVGLPKETIITTIVLKHRTDVELTRPLVIKEGLMFAPDDKVTLLMNTQCHGVVLESDEATTLVRLDRLSFDMLFKTSELKLRKKENS